MLDYTIKRPNFCSAHWFMKKHPITIVPHAEIWEHKLSSIQVVSSIEYSARGLEYKLTINEQFGKYPKPWVIELVRDQFGAHKFTQDDDGLVSAILWLPVTRK